MYSKQLSSEPNYLNEITKEVYNKFGAFKYTSTKHEV